MHDPATSSLAAFRPGFEALLRHAPAGTVRHHHFLLVPSDRKPWLDTGIDLAAGESVTTFGSGRTSLKGTNLSFGADFQLWCRIGPEGSSAARARPTASAWRIRAGSMLRATSLANGRPAPASSPRRTRPMPAPAAIPPCW
jgi:hypothetical protein